jgi:hypothetical protein
MLWRLNESPCVRSAKRQDVVNVLQVPTHLLLRRSGCWDLLFRPERRRTGAPIS